MIGARDENGRVVLGPLPAPSTPLFPKVSVPEYLKGEQLTLFGPPDDPRMSVNAMNSLHRVRPGEPAIVKELVEASKQVI